MTCHHSVGSVGYVKVELAEPYNMVALGIIWSTEAYEFEDITGSYELNGDQTAVEHLASTDHGEYYRLQTMCPSNVCEWEIDNQIQIAAIQVFSIYYQQ